MLAVINWDTAAWVMAAFCFTLALWFSGEGE